MTDPAAISAKRAITSEQLSGKSVVACWMVSIILLGAGITATFVAGTGAAPAAMVLLGSLFLILALMRRVPLSLEVGGAKFDASYETTEAFDAGREVGLEQGVEVAIHEVEKAELAGESPQLALERRRRWASWRPLTDDSFPLDQVAAIAEEGVGVRGPTACAAARITYRQLDYWGRTGLVPPSISDGDSKRLYSAGDVVLLRLVKLLLDAGVSLQQIRPVIAQLRGRSLEELEPVTVMSDGESVYEAASPDEVIDLLERGRGLFGVALRGVIAEVSSVLSELPSKGPGS